MLKLLLLPLLVAFSLSPSYASNWARAGVNVDGDMFVWVNTDQIVKRGSKGYLTDNRQVNFWQATGWINSSGDPEVRIEYIKGLCSPLTIKEETDRIAYSSPTNYYAPNGRNIKVEALEDISIAWPPSSGTMEAAGIEFVCEESINQTVKKFDSPDEMIDFMRRVIAKRKAEKGRPF